MITIYIIIHVLCGIYAAGVIIAYFQNEYPSIASIAYMEDLVFGVLVGLAGGPFAAISSIICSDGSKHGWSLRRRR